MRGGRGRMGGSGGGAGNGRVGIEVIGDESGGSVVRGKASVVGGGGGIGGKGGGGGIVTG